MQHEVGESSIALSRPSIEQTLLDLASTWSRRSTCLRGSAGCVIATHDGHVLASGFNGAPRGLPHCTEVGCLIEHGAPCHNCRGTGFITSGVVCWMCRGRGSWSHCVRAVHAEMNAIIQAAKIGVSLDESVAYATTRPCVRCSLALIQVGVKEVVYLRDYESDDEEDARRLFTSAGVEIRKAH